MSIPGGGVGGEISKEESGGSGERVLEMAHVSQREICEQ